MTDLEVLIIGAGPAGLAAAVEVRRAGLSVEIVEQRQTIGGAIYRQPIAGVSSLRQPASVAKRWKTLAGACAESRITVHHGSVFLGVDGNGLALVEDRNRKTVRHIAAKAVVIAVGAVEKVRPRLGWHLPGVATAGGLQVMMKETGRAPTGKVLLAGSGPLLIAIAAQMARLGNPPVAIVEAGNPVRRFAAGLRLAAYPALLAEALDYLRIVYNHGVPWLRAASLDRIEEADGRLAATLTDGKGRTRTLTVDRIGLHDGIRPNDFGLPEAGGSIPASPIVLRAGDCREALGAEAAIADGADTGKRVVRLLSGKQSSTEAGIGRFRRAQDILADMFAPVSTEADLANLPDETMLCRCENRTVGDLKALCARAGAPSGREVKHNGRFSMGACQGRFCADNTAALMAALKPGEPATEARDLTGRRWPLRPVTIAALVAAGEAQTISQDEPKV